jgi:hypothetical protein
MLRNETVRRGIGTGCSKQFYTELLHLNVKLN